MLGCTKLENSVEYMEIFGTALSARGGMYGPEDKNCHEKAALCDADAPCF